MKFTFLFFFFINIGTIAQETCHVKLIDNPVKNIDSLQVIAQSYDPNSTAYLKLLANIEYSKLHFGINDDLQLEKIKLLSERLKNPYGLAIYYHLKGRELLVKGERTEAFKLFNNGLKQFIANKDTVGIVLAYNALVALSTTNFGQNFGDLNTVLRYCTQSLDIARKYSNSELTVIALSVFSSYYYATHNLKKVEENELAKLSILKKNPQLKSLLMETYINLSTVYFYQQKFKDAYALLKSVQRSTSVISNEKYRVFLNNFAIASMYTQRFDEAKAYLYECLQLSSKDLVQQQSIYRNLQELYILKKEYKTALIYSDTAYAVRDSIFTVQTQQRLIEAQTKYQTAQKEQENIGLRKKNERIEAKNNQFKIFLLIMGGVVTIIMYLLYRLKKTNQQLNRSLANEQALNHTKDKIFSLLSHDLRKPLNDLGDLFSIWHDPSIAPLTKETLSNQISVQLTNVQFILNNLLQWSVAQIKQLPPNHKRVSVPLICQEAIAQVQSYIQYKQIRIIENLPALTLTADENQLLIILRNLLTNAVKFTPKNGVVSIIAEQKGNQILIKVRDTGIGMATEKLSKVFQYPDPSKGTKGTMGETGTGIGLSLCRDLIQLNGGDIQIKSKPDVGTEVTVGLMA